MSALLKLYWFMLTQLYRLFFGRIGKLTYIGPLHFGYALKSVFIGSRVRMFPSARFEVHGENASITIEDGCSIGGYFHCTAGGTLRIGQNTTILARVMISDIDHSYETYGNHILSQPHLVSETQIGENCFIGMGAIILPGTKLGNNCVVGANSVVRGTFDEGSVIVGSPAKVVKRFNKIFNAWERNSE